VKRNLTRLLLFAGLFCLPVNCNQSESYQDLQADLSKEIIVQAEQSVVEKARMICNTPPVTVTAKPTNSAKFGRKTYTSFATYWWPDFTKKDGLPYIKKDGQVNPMAISEESDLPRLIKMSKNIETLALAYQITNNRIFVDTAVEHLNAWFSDPVSSMIPHLEHAQIILGRNEGRSSGIIDTWWLIRVVQAIDTLNQSKFWRAQLNHSIKRWFTTYLNWLRNSKFGELEKNKMNNHGPWYDLQVIHFSLFTGQTEAAKQYLESVSVFRFSAQVTDIGRQPHETARPRPVHYGVYNLYGLLQLADYTDKLNIDDMIIPGSGVPNLENAVHYLTGMVGDKKISSFTDPRDPTDTASLYIGLLIKAYQLYNNPEFCQFALSNIARELSENPILVKYLHQLPSNANCK